MYLAHRGIATGLAARKAPKHSTPRPSVSNTLRFSTIICQRCWRALALPWVLLVAPALDSDSGSVLGPSSGSFGIKKHKIPVAMVAYRATISLSDTGNYLSRFI